MPKGPFIAQYLNKKENKGYVREYDRNYVWRAILGPNRERTRVVDKGKHMFPLQVGKRWRTFYKLRDAKGGSMLYQEQLCGAAPRDCGGAGR